MLWIFKVAKNDMQKLNFSVQMIVLKTRKARMHDSEQI